MFSLAWCPDSAEPLSSEAARERPTSLTAIALSGSDGPDVLSRFPSLQAVRTHRITFDDRWIGALEALPNLTELRLDKVSISASTLAGLARLKGLRSLSISPDSDASDDLLKTLGSLLDLERVDVRFTSAGAATLAALIKLPRLRELWIGSTKITGAALAKIPPLPTLELLEAGSLPWTPKALSAIGALPALRALDLRGAKKSLAGPWWSDIAARGMLERICLERTMVTPAELSSIVGSLPLREMILDHCPLLNDAAIAPLGNNPTLTRLSIGFSDHLGDAALKGLCASTSLRSLDISASRGFSQQALASLVAITSLREIQAMVIPLEDATLRAWMEALPLELCYVGRCEGLTPAGYRAARAIRPSCALHADEILMAAPKPELYADRALEAKLHEVAVNFDATVVVADYPGEIQVFDAQGAQRAKRTAVSAGNHLDFAKHGRWLVCDHNNSKVSIWDTITGKAVTIPSLLVNQPRAAITPDGSRVAVLTSLDLTVLDLPGGKPVYSTRLHDSPSALLLSDDGQLLALGIGGRVVLFDLAAGGAQRTLPQGSRPISFDRGALIVSTEDRAICVVDLATGQEIERWDPYAKARWAWLAGSHKPSFVSPDAQRSPLSNALGAAITQCVRTGNGFVALAEVPSVGAPSELITPDLVVQLGQRDGIARKPRLSGDGRWLVWPSSSSTSSVVRVWSVEALLAFAREHA